MSFASIESTLPEELVDRIARIGHKQNIAHVLHNVANGGVSNLTSEFDQAIQHGAANIKDYITEKYGDKVRVIVDDYIDWYTIVFIFPQTSRFALYHHYAEWHTCDQYLIDGSFTQDTFHVERYLHVDRRGEHNTECDYIHTTIPFKIMVPKISNYTFDLTACSQKIWKNPVEILLAFNKVEYGNMDEMEEGYDNEE